MENNSLVKINEILRKMGKDAVNSTNNFESESILDSIETIDFFVSLEKTYNVKISETDIDDKKLNNVSNLIDFLNSLNSH